MLGVVGDISYTDVSDEVTGNSVTPAFYTFERDLEWLATGRLRGGFAFNRFLVYATGGFAYGSIDYDFSTNSPAILVDVSEEDDDAFGYTVGGGVEAMLTPKISLGAEYLYTDLDVDTQTATFATANGGPPFGTGTDMRSEDEDFDFHTVRATLTYRFASGY